MNNYPNLKSITILYVEDSKFIVNTVLDSIGKKFHKIHVANNGKDGLELFKMHRAEIDIVITDLIMPVIDGKEMIEQIRKIKKDVPIIVTTAFDDFIDRAKLAEYSIDAFLSKPINPFKLLKNVNKIVDSLLLYRELETKKLMIDNNIIYSETDAKGLITYISKPFERISGYTKEELIGKTHALLKSHETPEWAHRELWHDLLASKQWQGEFVNKRKDGSLYTVQSNISPIYFRSKLIGYSSTSVDTTALKAASQELQIKSKQAAMGEMVAMIAHQWRQPITSIGLIAGNLRFDMMMDELDTDVLKEGLSTIDSHVKYLSNTIDIFRNFLKEGKKKEKTTMKNILDEVLLLVKEECKSNEIRIEANNECQDFKLTTFKDELTQAIINIVNNSKDALLEHKVIAPKIKIECKDDAKALYIAIADNGGGIKEEILPKIFTPYFSTKKEKHGTGLGLYMTKTIIEENLDGELSVQNKDDGVVFTITLPK